MEFTHDLSAEKQHQIQAHAEAIATLLYRRTNSDQLQTLQALEATVREQILAYVSPHIGVFLSKP